MHTTRPLALLLHLITLACLSAYGTTETVPLGDNVSLEMVWITPGTFLMGSAPGIRDAYPDEMPQHPVTLSHGFWLGKHEITQAQWKAVMGTTPWAGRQNVREDDSAPAVYISWHDANAFAAKLHQATGKMFRLPTEAEWEYAARAGTDTRFPWGDDLAYTAIDAHAWWRGNVLITQNRHARPVAAAQPSPWGLHDMAGNVFEWCHDYYAPYTGGPTADPAGPETGDMRVNRGGSWCTIAGNCRPASRGHDKADAAYEDLGFRIACSPAPESLAALEAGAPVAQDVFVAGRDGVNTYRIPALLIAPDNSLLAFCEARKESFEDASPTDLVMRQSTDAGATWQPMRFLVHGVGDEAVMNPCAAIDRATGAIFLFCLRANPAEPDHYRHVILTSNDSGKTWEGPLDLDSRITNPDPSFVFGPGIGIQMKSGRLVIPGYSGVFDNDIKAGYFSRVLYSDDHGRRWTLGDKVPQFTDESQAVELIDGSLMLNMRGDMGKGCRGVAISKDGGQTWADFHWHDALPECPCQAAIARHAPDKEGRTLLLFSNPDNQGEKFGVLERTRMTVRLSYDEGSTWPVKRLIHAGPSSYSSLVSLPDGNIGLLFEGGNTHRREWIRFVRFSPEWLTGDAGS